MKRRIVLISFTQLNAGGGVPRWNRDFIAGFPDAVHFSAWDIPGYQGGGNEWDVADALGSYLIATKKVSKDDIIISDGFWGERLASFGYNVISVAHGIWSHLTVEDVQQGKQPDFPVHHAVQVKHRREMMNRHRGRIVAVSDFISYQMKCQWDFDSVTINNAVDLEKFRPATAQEWGAWHWDDDPAIIHGVTNANKGFDHIEAVKQAVTPPGEVLLLDDAARQWEMDKYDALRLAHMVVQPSAYEGNSYFVLETLASGVPIVAYDVGLLWSIKEIAKRSGIEPCIGAVIPRKYRNPAKTASVAKFICDSIVRDCSRGRNQYNPRQVAELFSLKRFHDQWRTYLEDFEHRLDILPSYA